MIYILHLLTSLFDKPTLNSMYVFMYVCMMWLVKLLLLMVCNVGGSNPRTRGMILFFKFVFEELKLKDIHLELGRETGVEGGIVIIIICHSGLNKIAMGVIFFKKRENKMQKNLFACHTIMYHCCLFFLNF